MYGQSGGLSFCSLLRAVTVAHYSETLTDHVTAPRNSGPIDDPDLTGHAGAPGRGAFMILYLKVADDRVTAAKYHTVGCGPTIASGSMLTELIIGKPIAECRTLTVENLIAALDGVPPDKLHCPALAIAALQDACTKWSGVQAKSEAESSGRFGRAEVDDRTRQARGFTAGNSGNEGRNGDASR
jgi:nitrogen fixation NifU-like protein